MEVAKLKTNYTHFGKSLIPLIKGDIKKHRDAVFAEGGHNVREMQCFEDAIKNPRQLGVGIYYDKTNIPLELPEIICRTTMVRTKEWKLVLRSVPRSKEELYDLQKDPQELRNLIDNPELLKVKNELKEKLLRWYIDTSDNPPWEKKRLV